MFGTLEAMLQSQGAPEQATEVKRQAMVTKLVRRAVTNVKRGRAGAGDDPDGATAGGAAAGAPSEEEEDRGFLSGWLWW